MIGKKKFYSSVTVGERGQVVIPAEARQDLSIEPGEKLLVMQGPGGALLFAKTEQVTKMLNFMSSRLGDIEDALTKSAEEAKTQNVKTEKGQG